MDALAESRRRLGLSREALAERAGVTSQTICRLELGSRNPSSRTLRAIANALGYELVLSKGIDRG